MPCSYQLPLGAIIKNKINRECSRVRWCFGNYYQKTNDRDAALKRRQVSNAAPRKDTSLGARATRSATRMYE